MALYKHVNDDTLHPEITNIKPVLNMMVSPNLRLLCSCKLEMATKGRMNSQTSISKPPAATAMFTLFVTNGDDTKASCHVCPLGVARTNKAMERLQ